MNKNIILGIVLIALIGLYYAVERNDSSADVRSHLYELNEADISEMTFEKAGNKITLKKEGDVWFVDGYSADQVAVKNALKTLSDLKLSRFVSNNVDRQDGFEVNKKKGLTVTLKHADNTTTFIVGKQAASYKALFVRLENDNEIFSTKENFKAAIDKGEFDWKDKTIVSIPKEQITSIQVIKNGKASVIIQNRDSLSMVFGSHVETEPAKEGNYVANSMLLAFTNLNTIAFPKDSSINFSNPELQINITSMGSIEQTIQCVSKDETHYYIQVLGNTTIFELTKSKLENFSKNYTELIK
jgi:hypothetical protein